MSESRTSDQLGVGDRVEVTVGPVAHGGHFVARISTELDDRGGRVVFVRHALPGEQVLVAITEDSGTFLRGDAVEIIEPSVHRVTPPCPLAHPDGCGGCDFQHVALAEQRALKAFVVQEQLQRLAGISRDVVVEAVPGDEDGLRWRTRMQYVRLPRDAEGRHRGLRKYRSHEVIPVEDCLIARPGAREVVSAGEDRRRSAGAAGNVPGDSSTVTELVETTYGNKSFQVAEDGFWQVHPGAPTALVEAVMSMLAPQPGEKVLDLYSGVGLFSAYLAEAVGPAGSVTAVESDRTAIPYTEANLADYPWAATFEGRVDWALKRMDAGADIVVLDPPRSGAKRQVVNPVTALQPRAVAYVACDPAALARDAAYFADAGYELTDLRAFDLFPMTHHVECVALFTRR